MEQAENGYMFLTDSPVKNCMYVSLELCFYTHSRCDQKVLLWPSKKPKPLEDAIFRSLSRRPVMSS